MVSTSTPARRALFISHATPEDNDYVRWLGAKLSAMGYEVWADVMRLHGGVDWARQLENALRHRAAKMLLVCTPSGLEKQGVRNEIEIATQVAKTLNDDSFIIPLRLEAYEAPFRIAHIQYIDFKAGWARGLSELTDLLGDQGITRSPQNDLDIWLGTHSDGADKLLLKSQPLVSNWLELRQNPSHIHYCEPLVGSSVERFQSRTLHPWPVVPHRGGVVSFANPETYGELSNQLPGKLVASIDTHAFLLTGWSAYGIDALQARRMYADLGSQAFDNFCRTRGLKAYGGANGRVSWWGDIKTASVRQVKFDWNYRRGSRQIIGQSGKRGVHWHYALNAQLRTAPIHHLRLSARLVFTDNGLDALEDPRRSHKLRRSFAKGWRNPRWRDMLCAYIWWIADGRSELLLPVGAHEMICLALPPMQFSCPVSVAESGDLPDDEDDPDTPIDEWDDPIDGEGVQEQ
jgi:TIR domain